MVTQARLFDLVATPVSAMGYDLVDIEREGFLLRVFIDKSVDPVREEASLPSGITLYDCEKVSNHLNRLLTAENVDYQRLEISSPGLDRPLRQLKDFLRFANHTISLRHLIDRKNYTGILRVTSDNNESHENQFYLEIAVENNNLEPKLLPLILAEIDKVRLVPKFDRKEKKR